MKDREGLGNENDSHGDFVKRRLGQSLCLSVLLRDNFIPKIVFDRRYWLLAW